MANLSSVYTVNEAYSPDVEAPNVAQSDDPPSYNTAVPQGPPPSYDSLYGRVRAARDESSGTVDFLKTFLVIILSSIGFTILIGISLAVPVSMIVMGAVYQDDCPCEPLIPIYLIVAGSLGAAIILYSLIQRCRKDEQETEWCQTINKIIIGVLCACFFVAQLGCHYMYRAKDEFVTDDKDSGKYCDPTLYWFAFWITTAFYIIIAAFCCCVCSAVALIVGCAK